MVVFDSYLWFFNMLMTLVIFSYLAHYAFPDNLFDLGHYLLRV